MTSRRSAVIPHPVLREGGKDYEEPAYFTAGVKDNTVTRDPEKRTWAATFEFYLQDPAIESLIENGDACYAVIADSPRTHIREIFTTSAPSMRVELEEDEYDSRKTEFQTMVVALKDIKELRSPHWSPWIEENFPEGCDMPKGSILALGPQQEFSMDETKAVRSCVMLAPRPEDVIKRGMHDVHLDTDTIQILVNVDDLQAIKREMSAGKTMWSSLYMSAVTEAVREYSKPEYADLMWARAIAKKLEDLEIEPKDDEDLKANAILWAQEILEQPLNRILEEETADDEREPW